MVVVTYNRCALLATLLESIGRMDPAPGRVVVVDNASVDDTAAVVDGFRAQLEPELVHHRMEVNTGGAGGFSEGMRVAWEGGAEWIWLMDDDVEVLPDGLARMAHWGSRFRTSRAGATTTTAASSTGSTA
jgi:GT2 family glycosyltransferase